MMVSQRMPAIFFPAGQDIVGPFQSEFLPGPVPEHVADGDAGGDGKKRQAALVRQVKPESRINAEVFRRDPAAAFTAAAGGLGGGADHDGEIGLEAGEVLSQIIVGRTAGGKMDFLEMVRKGRQWSC